MAFRNSVKATLLLEDDQPRPRFDGPDPYFKAPPPRLPLPSADDARAAAAWRARAAALRAMAETLPSKTTQPLISKIAALYDDIASEAVPAPPDASAADDSLAEKIPAIAPPADPQPVAPIAFARRPLPLGRSFPRRRG
jgi:hypothetical protein